MRTTFLYILLLAALGAGVWYFLLRDDENAFGDTEAGFTLTDTASIGRIFLAGAGQSVTLQRTDTGWMLNDRYRVLRAPLQALLQALHDQAAVAPVSKAAHNGVVQALAVSGTKVEIYDRSGRRIRRFFVGNESLNYNGTYMLLEGAKRPYVVEVRGFEGFLTPRYSPRFVDWRDRTVFDVPAEAIRRVSVTYPDPERSFAIEARPGGPVVQPEIPGRPVDPKRAADYLQFFRNLNCESYVNGTQGLDTVLRTTEPKCSVAVTTDRGTRTADVYWMPATERTGSARRAGQRYDFDIERYYAVLDRKDTVVIQEQAFQKVFQQRAVFSPAPAAAKPQ